MERALHRPELQANELQANELQRMRRGPGFVGRALSHATTAFDRLALAGLRTFLSLNLPRFAPSELAAEIDRIDVFTDPETIADPDVLLAEPEARLRFNTARSRRIRRGRYRHLRAGSPYDPVHDEYVEEYAGYDRVSTVHLHCWQHDTPAPASILLTHGWGAGNRLLHQVEFGVRHLYRELGLDVYFYVAPFHGRRRPSSVWFNGELHPSPNLIRTNEGFVQTVQELRGIFTTILAHNDAPLGMMGSSLGGYTTALMASLDDRLSFAVPVLSPACLADLFWHQASRGLKSKLERMGMTLALFRKSWALHSPLSYRPQVPRHRRLIVSAVGDALVPEAQTQKLWEHWGRPAHFRFTGAHLLQLGARNYHREIGRFLHRSGVM